MKNLKSFMRLFVVLGVTLGLVFGVVQTASATSYRTITIDGTLDFASDEDVLGTNSSTWYFTWDATNFYFGANNIDIDDNSSSKWVMLYIDTDPQGTSGSSTGIQYNTQQPTLPFNADYHFRWKNDNSYTNMQTWNGSSWVDGDSSNITLWRNGTYIEFKIPRSNLGSPSVMKLVGGMINEAAGGEYTYFMTPDSNTAGYDANYTHYFGFALTAGVAPDSSCNLDTYPAATTATGNYDATSTWTGAAVPSAGANIYVANGHTLTLNGNYTVKCLTITAGGTFNGGTGSNTLTMNTGAILRNDGTYTRNTETIAFAGAGTVQGTVAFNNVELAGGVDFGSAATIYGMLKINGGGYVAANPPTYASGSTLNYNPNGAYTVNIEWGTGASGAGVPHHVLVSNGASVTAAGAATRTVNGNLQIDNGGTLILGGAAGNGLNVNGNWTNNGTFTHGSMPVTFAGTAAQSIGGGSTTTFEFLTITNSSGAGVSLNQNVVARKLELASGGKLSAGVYQITMQGSATNPPEFWNGGTFDAGTGTVEFHGTHNMIGRVLGSSATVFYNVTMISDTDPTEPPDRRFGVDFYDQDAPAVRATINGILTLNQHTFVAEEELGRSGGGGTDGAPIYGSASTLYYNNTASFNSAAEWKVSGICGNPSVPYNVTVANGTAVNINAEYRLSVNNGNALVYAAGSNKTACGNVNISSGSLESTAGTLTIKGNLTRAAGQTFTHNSGTVLFKSNTTQAISGAVTFYNLTISPTLLIDSNTLDPDAPVTVVNATTVKDGGLFWPATASSFFDIFIELNGALAPETGATINVSNNFDNDGTFTHNGGTVVFNGPAFDTQDLTLGVATTFNNLTVNTDVILVETVSTDNATVSGTLTNNGRIRKAQAFSATGSQTFGLTQVTVAVTTYGGSATTVTVDRIDASHANATTRIGVGKWWDISSSTGGHTFSLTLPHSFGALAENTRACRYVAPNWDCGTDAENSNNATTVTRTDITGFSGWAAGDNVGPNAIELRNLGAHSTAYAWSGGLALLALALGGAWLVLRRRR